MHILEQLWFFLLSGFFISQLAEFRINKSNTEYLKHHGARVRRSGVLEWFYRAQNLFILFAFVEHLYFRNEVTTGTVFTGLGILIAGFVVRHWGILSQGRLWTRHHVLFRQSWVLGNRKGSFLTRRPDYTGRVAEVVGLALALGSWFSLTFTVLFLPLIWLKLLREEKSLSIENI